MFGTALEQLFLNAVRHNESEKPTVSVRLDVETDEVSVAVADDGIGIPDVQQELLNDPDRRYHEQAGIGTGLYLVLTVVEQLGGEIVFADNDPVGTVVTVTLPRHDESG